MCGTWLQVEKLLEQYENITVELSEAAALQEKHAAATNWAARAQRVLDRERPFADEDAAMLEVHIHSHLPNLLVSLPAPSVRGSIAQVEGQALMELCTLRCHCGRSISAGAV